MDDAGQDATSAGGDDAAPDAGPRPAIGVISDVHGNLPALTAVLDAVDAAGIERIWCLGDTIGYGPFAAECCELVLARCELVLAGNHEVALRGIDAGNPFGGGAGAGLDHAHATLGPAQLEALAQLPSFHVFEAIEAYHAASFDPVWEYVADPAAAAMHLDSQRAPLSLVGHSHRQLAFWRAAPGGRDMPVEGGPATGQEPVRLAGRVVVANPGSVGQPRDGDPRAAWAVLTPEAISFHRIEYDIDAMAEACELADLPPTTAERLYRGE